MPEELQLVAAPGREPEPEVHEEASPNDRLVVRELVERELPVVPSHPAVSDSSERESIGQVLLKLPLQHCKSGTGKAGVAP